MLVVVAAFIGLAWIGRDWPVRAWIESGMTLVRAAGPAWFFAAMAVLPLPLFWFTVPAGEAFAAQLTLGGVIAAALAAIAVNLALAYALARWALRPALARLIRSRGYTIPQVTAKNALMVVLLVRLTPGPPLFLQCWILAIAGVPFRLYMIASWLLTVPWIVGGVVLGRGALTGNFKILLAGAGVLVAAVMAVRWLRKNYLASGNSNELGRG